MIHCYMTKATYLMMMMTALCRPKAQGREHTVLDINGVVIILIIRKERFIR